MEALRIEQLGAGREGEALAFLAGDPVRNLRMIWAVRRWGLFNLGLAEQGSYLAAFGAGGMRGLLFRSNLNLWRLGGAREAGRELAAEALSRWGLPEVLAGPQDEVEMLLREVPALARAVERREAEVSLLLTAERFRPLRGAAKRAGEDDLDDLVELERMMQVELLGGCAADWVIRLQMRRAVEEGTAALVRHAGRAVAKAEMEASTPQADELGGVYTVPRYRRRGFASSACTLVCASSLARGKKVRLETQRENAAALAFYARLGFEELWPHLAVRFVRPGRGWQRRGPF
mgnify:CR=1 FL=1